MNLTNEQIARAISNGDFMPALDRLDDDVRREIDGKAEFIDAHGGVTRLASSDIYRFRGLNLVEITSYCVPLGSE